MKNLKRLTALLLSLSMAFSLAAPAAFAEEELPATDPAPVAEESVPVEETPDVTLPGTPEYVPAPAALVLAGNETCAADRLSENDRAVYDQLVAQLKKIAAGEVTSSVVTIAPAAISADAVVTDGVIAADSAAALLSQIRWADVLQAVWTDCPDLLYWVDTAQTIGYTAPELLAACVDGAYVLTVNGNLTFEFPVAAAYAAENGATREADPSVALTLAPAPEAPAVNDEPAVADEGEAHTHTPGAPVQENVVPASCSAEGSYESVVYCGTCQEEISRTQETIETLPHTPVTDPAVPATCSETGLTEGSHCSVCHATITAQTIVPKQAHSWGEKVLTKKPTSTTDGYYTYTCSVCTAAYKETIHYLDAPVLTSVSNTGDGVKFKWQPVSGACNYRVYMKTADTKWAPIGDTTATTYIATGLTSGTAYTFTARAVSEDGGYLAGPIEATGLTITYVSAPVVTKAAAALNGIKVTWEASAGAAGYRVYYKTAETGWTSFGTTTKTSLTVTGLTSGTAYTFTVRALDKAGDPCSAFDTVGKSATYVATPVLHDPQVTRTGVSLSWDPVAGAASYRIYTKTPDADTWTVLTDTAETDLDVDNLYSGTTYLYTVRALDARGRIAGVYDPAGKSVTWLAVPALTKASLAVNGVNLAWGIVPGATAYEVFYKTSTTGWTSYITTTETSILVGNLDSGKEYTFSVRARNTELDTTSAFDVTGKTLTYVAAPVQKNPVNKEDGVNLSWSAVNGAASYRVYIKAPGEKSWSVLADTTETTMLVPNLTVGAKYSFTVRALNSAGRIASVYDTTGKSITYLTPPVVKSAANAYQGIKVTWKAVTGASYYRVYYKTADAGWKGFATVTSDTTQLITGLKSGVSYTFTVRCCDKDGNGLSAYNTAGKSATYIAAPTLTAASCVDNGIKVSWKPVAGTVGYRVYYKTVGGSWKSFGTTTDTSMVVTGLNSLTTYVFTVRCVDENGSSLSAYDPDGKTARFIPAPVLKSTALQLRGIQVTWEPVYGVAGYRVYYKSADSDWTVAANTSGSTSSVIVTGLKSGTRYAFSVRCVDKDGKLISARQSEPLRRTYYEAPVISGLENTTSGLTINWNAVNGVSNYRVYYKTGTNDWKSIGTSKTNSMTVANLTPNVTYSFTVACINEDGKALSLYDTIGKSTKYFSAVTGITVTPASQTSVNVSWNLLPNVTGYYVLQKDGDTWTTAKLVSATGTNHATITGLTFGKTYTFTVRAYQKDGANTYLGACNTTGVTQTLNWHITKTNGLSLYYDNNNKLIPDISGIIGSRSSYQIKINRTTQIVTVYTTDSSGSYTLPVKSFYCSTGNATPTGTFKTPERYRWRSLYGNVYGQWATRIVNSILFHSVPYEKDGDNKSLEALEYNKLGTKASLGCIRLECKNVKWIYDNCALGTTVIIYDGAASTDPLPATKPVQLDASHTWDPTDPECASLCASKGCHQEY